MKKLLGFLIIVISCFSNNVSASLINLTLSGQLTVHSLNGDLNGTFSNGDLARLKLTYNTNSPDSLALNPELGIYLSAITAYNLHLGGKYSASSSSSNLEVFNPTASNPDSFSVRTIPDIHQMIAPSVNGLDLTEVFFSLIDKQGTWLDSDLLPAGFLPLADFEGKSFRIDFGEDDYLTGTIDNMSVTTVPIPAAAWLFGSALIGFVAFSTRRTP
ncbi:MAG: VPLPA-CTERM sorting domain-containing protein [Candidatus Thiodiazotropha sp.]